jgi:surface polysaccharide O-acyltransferase-like enzyme
MVSLMRWHSLILLRESFHAQAFRAPERKPCGWVKEVSLHGKQPRIREGRTTPVQQPQARRIAGIDLFRFIGFVAVVLIHTVDLGVNDAISVGRLIVAASRFAVPFFFIAAGYFLPRGFAAATTGMARRLFPVFLIWGLFYCWLFNDFALLRSPLGVLRFFYTGLPAYHLWFLPSMGMAVVIFAAARTRLGWSALFALALLFYLVGMALGPWHTMLGLPSLGGRNGPFFALFFVTLGAWWKVRVPPAVRPLPMAALVVAAFGALLVENWLLLAMDITKHIAGPDFGLMTIPYGAAVFLFAFNCHVGPLCRWVAKAGPATLGMYLVHILMIMFAQRIFAPVSLGSRLGIAGLTVLSSAAVTLLVIRIPVIRRIVS